MIAVPAGVRVLVATRPVDFRRGADSLTALAREELQREQNRPWRSSHAFQGGLLRKGASLRAGLP